MPMLYVVDATRTVYLSWDWCEETAHPPIPAVSQSTRQDVVTGAVDERTYGVLTVKSMYLLVACSVTSFRVEKK